MKTRSRYLPSLTLAEWGAIMLYFCASGRIAAFLHPSFRPIVLVTGLLLIGTAAMLFFSRDAECGHPDGLECCGHDHEDHHHHEHESHEHGEHEHCREKLTVAGVLTFFVLLLPLALATVISPDSYGAGLIANRGMVENVQSLPGVAKTMDEPVGKTTDRPAAPAKSAEAEYPAFPDVEPPLPAEDTTGSQAWTPPADQIAADSQQFINEFLKPNKDGNIEAEVIDLLYAAEDASMRRDFDGKRVEMIGQFLPLAAEETKAGKFKLVRLFMVCCAADVMPISVMIVSRDKIENFKSMEWIKVVGSVSFGSTETIGAMGERHVPLVTARSVTKVSTPNEPYLF